MLLPEPRPAHQHHRFRTTFKFLYVHLRAGIAYFERYTREIWY